MSKDPAFLFYPGDYLRDTQCLSADAQVAYDRIMCEHMRNISLDMINITVSKERVDFFTKRLNDIDKEQLISILCKVGDDYQIEWVAEKISERRVYSESRRTNRNSKKNNHMSNTSSSYDAHMEDEIEDENEIEDNNKKEGRFYKLIPVKFKDNNEFWEAWKNWFDLNLSRGTELLPNQAKEQFKYLEKHPDPIGLLKQAFANGWKGIIYKDNSKTDIKPQGKTIEHNPA
jgi:hypothetical protein